ncbi:MAG: hybrid sensor histidine kinase/response regulator [Sandaracinus sp.]
MARILHIEDDPSSRLLVRKLLAAAGHEVVDAETGLEGIRLARSFAADLVLVDINIPDLDGYEVALRLRSEAAYTAVPIVAITAEGDRATSLAVGCDGFLEKPIDARKFAKTIARYLEGHRERSEDAEPKLREASHRIVERLEAKVQQLSEANVQLEEVARLRREFLRNLTHELATPMTPVVGYAKLLLAEELGPVTPMQRKALVAVEAGALKLRALVDTLLDVSALETGRMSFAAREYDLRQLAERVLDDAARTLEERGLVVERLFAPGLTGSGDPEKLRRAIAHVVENATKFTPTGGRIAVEGGIDGSDLWVTIADSGPGVPADRLEKVLEPFYQVDGSVTRAYGGVGLGLAFVRRVVEAHGGSVTVTSPPAEVAGLRLGGTGVTLRVRRVARFPERL